jgi:hypothetical protein
MICTITLVSSFLLVIALIMVKMPILAENQRENGAVAQNSCTTFRKSATVFYEEQY